MSGLHVIGQKMFRVVIVGTVPPGVMSEQQAMAAIMNGVSTSLALGQHVQQSACEILDASGNPTGAKI